MKVALTLFIEAISAVTFIYSRTMKMITLGTHEIIWGNVDLASYNVTYLVLECYNVPYTFSSPWED